MLSIGELILDSGFWILRLRLVTSYFLLLFQNLTKILFYAA